jgi:hypothetical protein
MIELTGQPAEVHITLEITRKATGKTETVNLIGKVNNGELDNGSHAQHSGTERSDGCSHGTDRGEWEA